MTDAIEHAQEAGRLDSHWLELAHISQDLSMLAGGRVSDLTVAKWCEAESLRGIGAGGRPLIVTTERIAADPDARSASAQ